jgi:hypothetical protein
VASLVQLADQVGVDAHPIKAPLGDAVLACDSNDVHRFGDTPASVKKSEQILGLCSASAHSEDQKQSLISKASGSPRGFNNKTLANL